MEITVLNGKFCVRCSYFENEKAQAIPKRSFKKAFAAWSCPAVFDNAAHMLRHLKACMSEEAVVLARSLTHAAKPVDVVDVMPPELLDGMRKHQQDVIELAWSQESYGILHRPRCGKTASTIRIASGRHIVGAIDRMVVFCPNSIKTVWAEQWEQWGKTRHSVHLYDSGEKKQYAKWLAEADGLRVLVIGIESMSAGSAKDIVNEFVKPGEGEKKSRTICVVDESTRIKNHKSLRTKAVWDVGEQCQYRNILTGSELTRNPEDLFAQFRFLGIHTLGYDSFYAWRNRYIQMGGFEKRQVVGVLNADELMERIAKYSHLVKTSDIVDLPPKVFSQRVIKPTDDQKRVIKELNKKMETEYLDDVISVSTVMTYLLRAQQICGGFFPAEQEDGSVLPTPMASNPKLDELLDIVAEEPGKVIIWVRFKPEVRAIVEALRSKYGDESTVEFHGDVNEADRQTNRNAFQNNDRVRYFVANPTLGSMGLELSSAALMVYYSQDNMYESRVQSLERATNLTKFTGVGIIDLVLDVAADWQVANATAAKKDMAEFVEQAIQRGQRISLV